MIWSKWITKWNTMFYREEIHSNLVSRMCVCDSGMSALHVQYWLSYSRIGFYCSECTKSYFWIATTPIIKYSRINIATPECSIPKKVVSFPKIKKPSYYFYINLSYELDYSIRFKNISIKKQVNMIFDAFDFIHKISGITF